MKKEEERERVPFHVRYNRAVNVVQRLIEKLSQGGNISNPQAARERMKGTYFVSQIVFSFAVAGSEAIKPHARRLALLLFGEDVEPVLCLAERLDVSWKALSRRPWGWKKGQFLGDLGYYVRKLKRSDVEAAISRIPEEHALDFDDLVSGDVDWRDFLLRNLPPASEPESPPKKLFDDEDFFFEESENSEEKPEPASLAKKAGLDIDLDELFS